MLLVTLAFSVLTTLNQKTPVEPWNPINTTLPKEFVSAVNFALQHGMADPRGGEASTVKVKISNSMTGALNEYTVKGWLLPESNGKKRVVLTTGLSYPVESVVRTATFSDEEDSFGTAYITRQPYNRYALVANLALTGNIDLSEKTYFGTKHKSAINDFLGVTQAYLSNRYLRAVEAHMRGDDQLALDDALAIQNDFPKYQAHALYNPKKLIFLDTLPMLIEDSRRRLSEANLPQKAKSLIGSLDEVNARQMFQPGGVDVGSDPIIVDIVKLGNALLSQLIEATQNDTRLTRSVSFGRDFDPNRELITVKQAALTAIREIIQFRQISSEGVQPTVPQIKEFMARYGLGTPQERWYRVLADDKANIRQWQEATNRILDRRELVWIGNLRGYRESNGPMQGESLRAKQNPSVTDLLTKRAEDLLKNARATSSDVFAPVQFSLHLDAWDSRASLPVLQQVSRLTMEKCSGSLASTFHYGAKNLLAVLKIRLAKNDQTVFTEYAAFLPQLAQRIPLTSEASEILNLLIENQDHPELKGLSDKIFFDDPKSRWNLANEPQNSSPRAVEQSVYKMLRKLTVVQQRLK